MKLARQSFMQDLAVTALVRLQSRRGAYSEELAVLVACVVGVAVVMGGYYRDSLRGLLRWAEVLCNTLAGV